MQPQSPYATAPWTRSATRATTVLHTARDLLHAYADQIADESLRQSFLENVATHQELLRAAAADEH